jgi:hypothetical protein
MLPAMEAAMAQVERIPRAFKLAYTAFLAVLVPYYWATYTPWNFLYFCDVALLMTLAAIWLESPLILSMAAVGILVPQGLWIADFLARAVAGVHITGMTGYMFDGKIPLFVRGLSTFHGWLPIALVWLVRRLGYDSRALRLQAFVGVAVLLVSYFVAPAPPVSPEFPNHAVNINYVYGLNDLEPQTLLPPPAWLALLTMIVLSLYVPAHLVLRRVALRPAAK